MSAAVAAGAERILHTSTESILTRTHQSAPIAEEFSREVEFGMTPMQAIQSATSRAAELLGKRGEIGVIAPGAYADVIAVAGDPLADITVLKSVQFVMKDGVVFQAREGAR